MDQTKFRCGSCGNIFSYSRDAQSCFCPCCGKKVILNTYNERSSGPVPNQYESFLALESKKRTQRKEENWKYSKIIGAFIVIVGAFVSYNRYSQNLETNVFLLSILPFVVSFFYPFPDDWAFMRKVWKWIWTSILCCIMFFVLFLVVAIVIYALFNYQP